MTKILTVRHADRRLPPDAVLRGRSPDWMLKGEVMVATFALSTASPPSRPPCLLAQIPGSPGRVPGGVGSAAMFVPAQFLVSAFLIGLGRGSS